MFEEAARAVLHAARITPGRGMPTVVGVAGPPGSGKTTLARAIVEHADDAVAVPMDGFHLSNRQLALQGLSEVKGAPATFDRAGLLASMRRLGSSESVYFPDFDHAMHEPVAASVRVDPDTALVVVEGNYLLLDAPGWRDVSRLLDVRVFLDVPWSLCRQRLIPRHIAAGKPADAARQWVDRSDRANYDLLCGSRIPADIVVTQDADETRVSLNA